MKKLGVLLVAVIFTMTAWSVPAKAGSSAEIEQLKKQVERQTEELTILKKKIDELEKKQSEPQAVTGEVAKKAVEAEKKGLQAGYNKGFYIKTPDENFLLKTNLFLQFRYTFLDFDREINANDENWSNFFLRRARVVFSGNAPNK
ncbi:MAG: hypothetical protein AB1442_09580, partial [Nitrospirota bacterium]